MALEFEEILPYVEGEGDTGKTAREKINRNFTKIKPIANVGAEMQQLRQDVAEDLEQLHDDVEEMVDKTTSLFGYYNCSTAGATAAKSVQVTNYELTTGGNIRIKMEHANTTGRAVTLQIGNATAKQLYYNGKPVTDENTWEDNEVIVVYYDGTSYYATNSLGGSKESTNILNPVNTVYPRIDIEEGVTIKNGYYVNGSSNAPIAETENASFCYSKYDVHNIYNDYGAKSVIILSRSGSSPNVIFTDANGVVISSVANGSVINSNNIVPVVNGAYYMYVNCYISYTVGFVPRVSVMNTNVNIVGGLIEETEAIKANLNTIAIVQTGRITGKIFDYYGNVIDGQAHSVTNAINVNPGETYYYTGNCNLPTCVFGYDDEGNTVCPLLTKTMNGGNKTYNKVAFTIPVDVVTIKACGETASNFFIESNNKIKFDEIEDKLSELEDKVVAIDIIVLDYEWTPGSFININGELSEFNSYSYIRNIDVSNILRIKSDHTNANNAYNVLTDEQGNVLLSTHNGDIDISAYPTAKYLSLSKTGGSTNIYGYVKTQQKLQEKVAEDSSQLAKNTVDIDDTAELLDGMFTGNFVSYSEEGEFPIGVDVSSGGRITNSIIGCVLTNQSAFEIEQVKFWSNKTGTSIKIGLGTADLDNGTYHFDTVVDFDCEVVVGENTIDVSSLNLKMKPNGLAYCSGATNYVYGGDIVRKAFRVVPTANYEGNIVEDPNLNNLCMQFKFIGRSVGYAVKVSQESLLSALKSNVLYGKKYVAIGDSFTDINSEHCELIEDGPYQGQKKTYGSCIANRNNMNYTNLGKSGHTLARWIAGGYYNQIPSDVDYITIWFGINDNSSAQGGTGVILGDISDETDVATAKTLSDIENNGSATFCGCFNIFLRYLITNFPYAKIGVIVTGLSSKEFRDAERRISEQWGIPYLDIMGDPKVPMLHSGRENTSGEQTGRIFTFEKVLTEAATLRWNAFSVGGQDGDNDFHPTGKAHEYQSTFIENFLRSL